MLATATHATDSPLTPPSVATVAVASALEKAANDPETNADRWCWPHGDSMNTEELDCFAVRVALFGEKGVTVDDAEAMADRLVIRDRGQDDRRLCSECSYLARAGGWRCGNWQQAGVALRSHDAQLSTHFVKLLQRCHGFLATPGV